MNIEIIRLDQNSYYEKKYEDFLLEAYGPQLFNHKKERFLWYKQNTEYYVFLAVMNHKIVAQSCGYKVNAIINNKKYPFWWSVDTIALEECRGKGIGKMLQKKLSDECENFSSAFYSKINGIIKRKCGGDPLFPIEFIYYPVSNFVSYYTELIIKKIAKKDIHLPLGIPYFYSNLNAFTTPKYTFVESSFTSRNVDFINKVLAQNYDFYIERNESFINWKYENNPSITYHLLEVYRNKDLLAIVICSDIYKTSYLQRPIYAVKLLDVFSIDSKKFSTKHALQIIVDYYKKQGKYLDGILSIHNCSYFPKLVYPKTLVLSTFRKQNITNPYLSYNDQDMEQMLE